MDFSTTTLAELTTDGKGSYGIAASAVDYSDTLYTYLRITDIRDDGTLNKDDLKSVDDKRASQYILNPNDIVFARTGASTGRNYFYDGSDGQFVYAGFLIKFSIDPKKVNPKYVKYYCMSDMYKGWVHSFKTGSTRGNINAKTLGNMVIPIPSRKQQDGIVNMLSSIDEKIKGNNEINKNLEAQAMALINDYCASVIEKIALGKLMSLDNGYAFQSKTYLSSGKYRIITIKNVQDGKIDSQGAAYINEIPTRMKSNCFLSKSDVLLSLTGNVGRVGIVYEDNLLLNQRVAKICPFNNALLPWLYYYFRLPSTKVSLETIAKGTAQQNLSPVETLKLQIPFEMASANNLSQVLLTMFNMEISNFIESQQLSKLRDVLLPQLMSGELDVSDIDL